MLPFMHLSYQHTLTISQEDIDMAYSRYNNRYARFSAPAAPSPLGYTDKQAAFLASLVDAVQAALGDVPDTDPLFTSVVDALVPHLPVVDAVKASQPADRALVSSAIDALVKLKTTVTTVRAPQVAAQVAVEHLGLPKGARVIPTRYGGKCSQCGTPTTVGVDLAVQTYRWEPWCLRCADTDPADRAAAAARAAADAAYADKLAMQVLLTDVRALIGQGPDSKATVGVAIPDVTNDLDFLVLKANRVLRTIGGHGDQPLVDKQAITLLGRLVAMSSDERHEAVAAYGRELGFCGRCGRHLTDEHSRAAGIGPDCASKAWA